MTKHARRISARQFSVSLLLLTSVITASCAGTEAQKGAAGGQQGGGQAGDTQTTRQMFESGQNQRFVPPSQTQMLGPAAGGANALTLVPGLY